MTDASTKNPSKPRRGRPPAAELGQAEEKVLRAATQLFLDQGFGRTTLDQVSRAAGTGKSALYARFPDKEALFAAVVRRSIMTMLSDLTPIPPSATLPDRLRHVGMELARALLIPRCVSLMRMTAAESTRFPDLATMAYEVSFAGSARAVLAAFNDTKTGSPDPDIGAASLAAAQRFVELALQPLAFQATFGADMGGLLDRCLADIDDAIALLDLRGALHGERAPQPRQLPAH